LNGFLPSLCFGGRCLEDTVLLYLQTEADKQGTTCAESRRVSLTLGPVSVGSHPGSL